MIHDKCKYTDIFKKLVNICIPKLYEFNFKILHNILPLVQLVLSVENQKQQNICYMNVYVYTPYGRVFRELSLYQFYVRIWFVASPQISMVKK